MQEGMKKTMRDAINTRFGHLMDKCHLSAHHIQEYRLALILLKILPVTGKKPNPLFRQVLWHIDNVTVTEELFHQFFLVLNALAGSPPPPTEDLFSAIILKIADTEYSQEWGRRLNLIMGLACGSLRQNVPNETALAAGLARVKDDGELMQLIAKIAQIK